MHIEIEPELASVLQFMESKISAEKLQLVANSMPGAARLLWNSPTMARLSKEPICPSGG
jgi:hypothetical protein